MSALIENDPHNDDLGVVDDLIEPNLDELVLTPKFDRQCLENARTVLSSDKSCDSDEGSLWSSDDSVSSNTAVKYRPCEVSKFEANLYYAGVGPKGRGPKLIYRTSDDKFEEPSGPEAYTRLMRVVAVPETHQLGQNGLWDVVRDKVVDLLDKRNIKVSSVDLVRFTWINKEADQEVQVEVEDEDEDNGDDNDSLTYDDIPLIQPVEYGQRHYTNATIWVGVLPETLTAAVARESAKDIRALLDSLQVQNVDVAYRESVYKHLTGHGPALFRPVEDEHPFKEVIDNVSVPLSLPIAGRTSAMQGTLGPYFRIGEKLYAITARHNLLLLDRDNEVYRCDGSRPTQKVLVMGPSAFTNYLASIQALIGANVDAAEVLEKNVNTFKGLVRDGIDVEESQTKLDENEAELTKMRNKIDALKKKIYKDQKKVEQTQASSHRICSLGSPMGVGVGPHRYTRDFCVIELYKDKFKHMIGNVLSLGPEFPPAKLKALMYDCVDVPSKFKYQDNGLLALRGMLTADQVNEPIALNLQGDRIRRVIKRGFTTNTTVGILTQFTSFVRKYFPTGNMDSVELAILSHENDTGTYSKGGDSGSLIVSARGEFVALLTGGTNNGTDGSHITFATPFKYVWDSVKEEFPGADLYFDNLEDFLADVA